MRLARTEDAAYLARGSIELRDLLLASELGADFPFHDLSERGVSELYGMMDWFAVTDEEAPAALEALRRQISDGEHQYVCVHRIFTDGTDRFSVDFGGGWRRTYLNAENVCITLSRGISGGNINWSQVPRRLRDLVRDQLPVILAGARDDLQDFNQEVLPGTGLIAHRQRVGGTVREVGALNLWSPRKWASLSTLLNLWPMIHPEGTCPMMMLVSRGDVWEERRGPWDAYSLRAVLRDGGVLVADDARTQWSQLARGWLPGEDG